MTEPRDNLGPQRPLTPPTVMVARMRWLVRLRWIYVAACALLAAGLWVVSVQSHALSKAAPTSHAMSRGAPPADYTPEISSLIIWGGLLAIMNVAVVLDLRRRRMQSAAGMHARAEDDAKFLRRVALAQLLGDVAALSILCAALQPLLPPLPAVLVFHLGVAASLVSPRRGYLLAALTAVLYMAVSVLSFAMAAIHRGVPAGLAVSVTGLLPLLGQLLIVPLLIGSVFFVNAILSRLRRINATLAAANRELAALDMAKSRFLRVSSHQLQGGIAAVHSLLSAMEDAGPLTPKQTELRTRSQARASDLMAQLDDMMLLSTIKEETSEVRARTAVSVEKVLRESITKVAAVADHKKLSLTFSGNGTAIVHAWPDALETVMKQLLENAVRYTPSGGQVAVRATHVDERRLRIDVTDTGIGIPADQQERLFSEFFRATNARQVCGGTGLGLSIVKAIVDRLGGSVRVQSAGGGTTVSVELPCT